MKLLLCFVPSGIATESSANCTGAGVDNWASSGLCPSMAPLRHSARRRVRAGIGVAVFAHVEAQADATH